METIIIFYAICLFILMCFAATTVLAYSAAEEARKCTHRKLLRHRLVSHKNRLSK
jgi:hypothetical protein